MPVITQSKENSRARQSVRMLCEGAVMVALALVLNQLKIFRLPNGGSITLEMLPIFFYAIRWGFGPGVLAGFAFGLLQMFIDGAVAWGWQSLLLDYLIAFPPLGLAGLFRGKKWGIFAGTVVGSFVRFIVHFISGITIYAIAAPTELFDMTFTSPWMYSLAYNGSYMLIDIALCLAIFGLLYRPMKKYFMGYDLLR